MRSACTWGGLRVTNLSDRPTVHVVQAYVELEALRDGPALVGFARVPLAPGETRETDVVLGPDAFLRFDPTRGRRAVVDGTHRLRLALDSLDPGHCVDVHVASRPVAVTALP